MIHALQYQNTIICTNKIQGITGVVRTTRTCFAVCPQLCKCMWVKNPATHKGSEEPLKIHHQAQPPNPNQSLHHSGNYHQPTSATEEGSLGLDEESSDEIPKSCGKQQREAWEDGRMSCSNCRDSGLCSNVIPALNSFLDLNTKHEPEYMSPHQSKALTIQETFGMED